MASRRTSESKSRSKPIAAAPPAAEPVSVPPAPTASASSTAPKKRAAPKAKPAEQARPAISEDMRRGMIAEAAYLRAERRGFGPGREDEDWLAAEAEVNRLLSVEAARPQ